MALASLPHRAPARLGARSASGRFWKCFKKLPNSNLAPGESWPEQLDPRTGCAMCGTSLTMKNLRAWLVITPRKWRMARPEFVVVNCELCGSLGRTVVELLSHGQVLFTLKKKLPRWLCCATCGLPTPHPARLGWAYDSPSPASTKPANDCSTLSRLVYGMLSSELLACCLQP